MKNIVILFIILFANNALASEPLQKQDINMIFWSESDGNVIAYAKYPGFISLRDFVFDTLKNTKTSVATNIGGNGVIQLISDDKRQFLDVSVADDGLILDKVKYPADMALLNKFRAKNTQRRMSTTSDSSPSQNISDFYQRTNIIATLNTKD